MRSLTCSYFSKITSTYPKAVMMRVDRPRPAPTIIAALLAVAGCATEEPGCVQTSGICDGVAAMRLVGALRISDADAMRLTGAGIVRQIAPGQPVQQDYTSARVTIETDPSSGRIAHAACG
jgi:hypothetical protein